jgi:hypothetical protein
VSVSRSGLVVEPEAVVSPALRAVIRHQQAELVALLAQGTLAEFDPPPAPPPASPEESQAPTVAAEWTLGEEYCRAMIPCPECGHDLFRLAGARLLCATCYPDPARVGQTTLTW